MATVQIGSSMSKCLGCGKSAGPDDDGHTTIYGYGPENGKPGCGEPWTAVELEYSRYDDDTKDWQPVIGYVFENLRGLPIVGVWKNDNLIYPND